MWVWGMSGQWMIEIVTSCWAGQSPHYAQALRLQLLSLARYTPAIKLAVSVCYAAEDAPTVAVVEEFRGFVQPICLPLSLMWCRTPGRAHAARLTNASLIWHTDCDFIFGSGCLDALWD